MLKHSPFLGNSMKNKKYILITSNFIFKEYLSEILNSINAPQFVYNKKKFFYKTYNKVSFLNEKKF